MPRQPANSRDFSGMTAMTESLRGHFLIAGKHLRECFYRTVVFLIEHHSGGAMGVIINSPGDLTVEAALRGHFEIEETGRMTYSGGPVDTNRLVILHNCNQFDQEHGGVIPGVFVGTGREVYERVEEDSRHPDPAFQYRLFAGYSGWSPGQLEDELKSGDWLVIPARREMLFRDEPYQVWEDAMAVFRATHRLPSLPGLNSGGDWN